MLASGTAIIILIHSQIYWCYISLLTFNAPFSKTLLLLVQLVTFTHATSLIQPFTIKGSIGIVIKIIFFLENIHSPTFILERFLFGLKFFLEIPVWNWKKNAISLSVNVFSTKVLIRDTILLLETGLPFYMVMRAMWRSSHLQGKGSTWVLVLPHATSHSAVKWSSYRLC